MAKVKVKLGPPREEEIDGDRAAEIDALADEVDARYAQAAEARVTLRWDAHALAVVKRAAALAGVPYQTYLKQATYRQALTDLRDATAAGIRGATAPSD